MTNRIVYFDNIRTVLMLAIVLLHVSCVFATKGYWTVIRSPDTTWLANISFIFSESFAVAGFFVISGYFAMITLEKYPSKVFLKKRFIRIGIPLIITAITLNSIQEWILVKSGWVETFDLYKYIMQGEWKHHLWFLINLIIYGVFIAIFKKYIFDLDSKLAKKLTNVSGVAILFILPLLTVIALIIGKIFRFDGVVNSSDFLMYLPFFLLGILVKNNQSILNKFEKISLKVSLPIIIFGSVLVDIFREESLNIVALTLMIYVNFLVKWFAVALFFKFSRNYLVKRNYFSIVNGNASYIIYLVHHLWIVVYAIILMHYGIGGISGFISLFLLTIVTSLMMYKVIVSLQSKWEARL
ncbi:MAG: acyltransferase family protein [Sulfurovum sp.]|nr:acyltransferase family protein [Sulfurovum sp.]